MLTNMPATAIEFLRSRWTVLVIAISVLPIIMTMMGINFGSSPTAISADILSSGSVPADDLFAATQGASHHALLEWSAVTLAIIVFIAAFSHYGISGELTMPIIGIAMFTSGTMDAFHTMAALRLIDASAANTDLIPFTWALSRTFNAVILSVGVVLCLRLKKSSGKNGFRKLILITASFGLVAYALINFAGLSPNLPQTQYLGAFITRPFDALPLIIFIIAGPLFWKLYKNNPTPMTASLLLALIPAAVLEAHMAFGSTNLFDHHFNIAHSLKILEYLIPFIGITLENTRTQKELLKAKDVMKTDNLDLEKEVNKRIHYSRMTQTIVTLANDAVSINDAMEVAVNTICGFLNWPVGHYYYYDKNNGQLLSSSIWYVEDNDKYKHLVEMTQTNKENGAFTLPMRAALNKDVIWLNDVEHNSEYPRFNNVEQNKIRTGIAFPIMDGDNVKGVMEFLTDENLPKDEALAQAMDVVGSQLGRAHERHAAMLRLDEANEALEQRVEARTIELAELTSKAKDASQFKTDFLANMSHEIRTPLNGVLGMVQALRSTEMNENQAAMLTTIDKSGTALVDIINGILDLSKIEAGKLDIETVPFDLEDTLETVLAVHKLKALEKSLELKIIYNKGAKGQYMGDPLRIRQILHNLISNAIKFTSSGIVEVNVERAERADSECKQIVISVKDNGIGINSKISKTLFSAFTQADTSTTRKYGGTGLGLAISKQLSELMGGWIKVESVEGEGSTFSYGVPLERIAKELTDKGIILESQLHAVPEDYSIVKGLNILAAEDVLTNQIVLKALLEPICNSLSIVENGQEALNAWERDRPDLILMDMQMPIMDGETALTELRIREMTLRLPKTPILALTANTMKFQIEEYMRCGADGHVAKPFRIDELVSTISKTMAKYTSEKNSVTKKNQQA